MSHLASLAHTNSDALAEFLSALRNRLKALKYKFAGIEANISKDDQFSPAMEKLDLLLRKKSSFRSATIRITFWHDRWISLDAREGNKKGWIWSFSYQGRLKGGKSGVDLVQFVEDFSNMLPLNDSSFDSEAALRFWDELLLNGPSR